VPDYGMTPEAAAVRHWHQTKAKLPPEFDKKVWIEPINEVDKSRSDWLGEFAWHIAQMANADGYKVLLFGWSAGEPEQSDWQLPSMLKYLRLCAERPDRAGVALHEYSYSVDDIWRWRGDLIGRFARLFGVCDANGIAHPTTVMTEWGWTLWDVPEPDKAMSDIAQVAELYAQYPAIKGAAIWYLGGGWQDIHNKTQRLIAPVTEYSLQARFPVNPPTPPTPPIPPPSGHKAIVVKAPQEATALEWQAIALVAHHFRHTMTASHDDMLTILDGGNASSFAKVAYPTRPSQKESIKLLEANGYRWEPLPLGNVPPDPPTPPPPTNTIDLLPYVRGDGRLYEVKNANGGQERFQTQTSGDRFYQTKNRHWEEMWADATHIFRGIDTSPGGGRFYTLSENGVEGSQWIPRRWAVGGTFTRSRMVQFYRCENGRVPDPNNSGNVTDTMQFVARHASFTFRTGITLQDVVELLWVNGGEKYFYAKGFGLVAWERQHQDPSTPAWSAISEIHQAGQRPDNERESIC